MDMSSEVPLIRPSCALEALNTDVIILIMLSVRSLEDLASLIHASSILYKKFLSATTSILLRVRAHSLRPTIRDVIILAHTEMKPFVNDNEYYDRVKEIMAI